jgi:methylenetetrahydrofolate reductase (NADPH)
LICGVSPSLRALRERHAGAWNVLAGEIPQDLLEDLANAQQEDPLLGVTGFHFFTFGALAATAAWAEDQRKTLLPHVEPV